MLEPGLVELIGEAELAEECSSWNWILRVGELEGGARVGNWRKCSSWELEGVLEVGTGGSAQGRNWKECAVSIWRELAECEGVMEEFQIRHFDSDFAKYTSVMEEPSSAQTTPGGSQATPRGRRGRDDDPVGPDDLVTVANVHRVVSHEMLIVVFPEFVMVGNNRRSFRELARMSHIRIMTDCQSVPMVEAVAEGHPVYYRKDNARRGTPTIERRTGFEFTLAFAKLCYARGVLRREVDFSRDARG
ncbi:hypothetical protein R1sor_016195 [Riccia sorocarpa]|uniref:Uncharacterized protein n=1 Tax=Riccia sorocarpa TaxID=122646 RepID=A0ABD3HGB9_9MARC